MRVPEGWAQRPLGDVATLQRGFDLPVQARKPGKIPVVASNGPVGTHNEAKVRGPGVVTGRSGTIGSVFFYEQDCWPLNTTLFVSEFHGNDPRFVAYLLSSLGLERYTAATGVPTLNRNAVHPVPVLVPPLGEQRRIASILSSVDEAIAASQAVIDQLQVVKKAMMGELLTKGIPGRHSRFKKTEIGEVPEGWTLVPLRDLCVENGLQTGPFGSQLKASEYTPEGVPVVMPKDLIDQRISTESIARIPESRAAQLSQHRVLPGDILFARRGDIGRCALVTSEESGWVCGTGCLRARPRAEVVGEYLVRFLSFGPVVAWLNERAVGQTMLNLNTDILSGTPIAVPPRDEQVEIAKMLAAIEENEQAHKGKRDQLALLKSALLSGLLTGEVRVRGGAPIPGPSPVAGEGRAEG